MSEPSLIDDSMPDVNSQIWTEATQPWLGAQHAFQGRMQLGVVTADEGDLVGGDPRKRRQVLLTGGEGGVDQSDPHDHRIGFGEVVGLEEGVDAWVGLDVGDGGGGWLGWPAALDLADLGLDRRVLLFGRLHGPHRVRPAVHQIHRKDHRALGREIGVWLGGQRRSGHQGKGQGNRGDVHGMAFNMALAWAASRCTWATMAGMSKVALASTNATSARRKAIRSVSSTSPEMSSSNSNSHT